MRDNRPQPARGLIPARAGRTRGWTVNEALIMAHPRSRGEDCRFRRSIRSSTGSSPLARGGRASVEAAIAKAGLIPARAGRTRLLTSVVSSTGAHPRSRGEDAR